MNQAVASIFKVQPHTADSLLRDLRFRRLLSDDDWMRLPPAVRQRFSKRLVCGATATYVGDVVKVSFSRIGWWLAQAARLIGGPLPISRDINVSTVVTVTEEIETGGQTWTRIYARRHGFPHVIHSSKRFSGPTGLEEYVGCGLLMTLAVSVDLGSLKFTSVDYCLQAGRRRFRFPYWLTPGQLTVTHTDLGRGRFLFRLELVHPWLGRLVDQSAVFREAAA
jgi:hypothetical protein